MPSLESKLNGIEKNTDPKSYVCASQNSLQKQMLTLQ
jgi:hypothetical protein